MVDGDAALPRRRELRGPLDSTGPVPRPPVPPEHRRRWILVTLVVAVLAVAAVTGGAWLYSRLVVTPPAPLALTTPTELPSNDPDVPLDLAGSWTVAEGSEAGYRIGEVLNGTDGEAVGRTSEVSGSVTIEGNALTVSTVVVRTAAIASDASGRDEYFRRALDTTTYPEAGFTSSTSVDLGPLSTATTPVTVEVPGTLTIRDRPIEVTAALQVQRTATGLEVVGDVSVALADLGLTPLVVGPWRVTDAGSVEFRLDLTR